MASLEKIILKLAERLIKEGLENPNPDPEVCIDLLEELQKETVMMTVALLESTKVGKLLTKASRSFKRHKRTASSAASGQSKEWDNVMQHSNKILEEWKSIAEKEVKTKNTKKISSSEPGYPRTIAEYRARLVTQKKDLYKDPPVLPPGKIITESKMCPPPERNKGTGILSSIANDPEVKAMMTDFHPNRTPEEVLRAGSFGGTYFRPIPSAVTNVHYNAQDVLKDTVKKEWIDGLPMNMLTSKTYDKQLNKFRAKCGGSLGMWESSGWITSVDPYGWFQWYCRFYQGRRCSDDARQISRWLKCAGPKGRFRSQLCNKILAAGTTHDDKSISPVIRQTLLHWGLEITPEVLEKHRKRVGR
jgi:hypothetical protein